MSASPSPVSAAKKQSKSRKKASVPTLSNSSEVLLEAEASKYTLGFLVIDLVRYGSRLKWGAYNERPIVDFEVKNLTNNFQKAYLAHEPARAIPIAVRKDWVNWKDAVALEDLNHRLLPSLPAFEFTTAGFVALSENKIHAINGNHRFQAALSFHQQLESWITSQEKKSTALPGEKEKVQDTLKKFQVGSWLVRLIDQGEFGSYFIGFTYHMHIRRS